MRDVDREHEVLHCANGPLFNLLNVPFFCFFGSDVTTGIAVGASKHPLYYNDSRAKCHEDPGRTATSDIFISPNAYRSLLSTQPQAQNPGRHLQPIISHWSSST